MWLRWSVCFHLPLGCPLIVDHRSHLTCEKMNHRGCYLSVHLHDSSHHEIVHQPSHWDDEEDGCACRFSCMVLPPCYPLFLLTFPMTLGVLLHRRGRRSRFASFSDLPNVSVHLLDVMVDILHDHRVLFSFERPSFAVLLLNVRWWTFWFLNVSSSSQRSRHPSYTILFLVIGLATPLLVHLLKVDLLDVPWCWPRRTCSVIRSCTSDWMIWQPFSIVSWAFFSCTAVNPPSLFPHLQKNFSQSASVATRSTLNVDFAACVFFDDLCCARDGSQLSSFTCFLFCVMPRGLPAVRGRIDYFTRETVPPLYFLLFRAFLISLWGWWSLWRTRTELCRSTRHSRSLSWQNSSAFCTDSRSTTNNRSWWFFQVEVGLVRHVGVRIRWRHEWECFPGFAYSKSSCHKSFRFSWIFMSWRSNMIQQWCVRILSLAFVRQRRKIQILASVTLMSSDVHKFFSLKIGMNLLIQLLTCHLWCFISFFLCLTGELSENPIRCQSFHHVRAVFLSSSDLFCHVFQRASSTELYFGINLTAALLEDLLSMEQ